MYLEFKKKNTIGKIPYPAIKTINAEMGSGVEGEIEITFQNTESNRATYFKPCVYLVKIFETQSAILKLAHNYNIDVHRKLATEGLAPKIIGYKKLCNRYHIILMEYFGETYDNLYEHFRNLKNKLDLNLVYQSLENILVKLKDLNIVHGDFRSANILAKVSKTEDDTPILSEFKLVDFELSGFVGMSYPFIAFINRAEITWPEDVRSYKPRKFDNDIFMLNQMKKKEMKLYN